MCEVPYLSFDKSETNKRNNVELRVFIKFTKLVLMGGS